jgi:hypothetical protein
VRIHLDVKRTAGQETAAFLRHIRCSKLADSYTASNR